MFSSSHRLIALFCNFFSETVVLHFPRKLHVYSRIWSGLSALADRFVSTNKGWSGDKMSVVKCELLVVSTDGQLGEQCSLPVVHPGLPAGEQRFVHVSCAPVGIRRACRSGNSWSCGIWSCSFRLRWDAQVFARLLVHDDSRVPHPHAATNPLHIFQLRRWIR